MQRLVDRIFAHLGWDLVDVERTLLARTQRCGLALWLVVFLACPGELSCAARARDYAVEDKRLALDAFLEDGLCF